jgi:hypothetical protein
MKKRIALIAIMGLLGAYGSAMAGDAEVCLDCHEPADDFAGLSADDLKGMIMEQRENPKHKATKGMSDEDVAKVAAALAAEAGG